MSIVMKFLGAAAVSGVVAIGGSAFTAAGLTNSGSGTTIIGGTENQTVTGATLANAEYHNYDTTAAVDTILLTFGAGVDGYHVSLVATGTDAGTDDVFTCTTVGASVPNQALCTAGGTDGRYDLISGIAVTVQQLA
jgi:hypothetical protein